MSITASQAVGIVQAAINEGADKNKLRWRVGHGQKSAIQNFVTNTEPVAKIYSLAVPSSYREATVENSIN